MFYKLRFFSHILEVIIKYLSLKLQWFSVSYELSPKKCIEVGNPHNVQCSICWYQKNVGKLRIIWFARI